MRRTSLKPLWGVEALLETENFSSLSQSLFFENGWDGTISAKIHVKSTLIKVSFYLIAIWGGVLISGVLKILALPRLALPLLSSYDHMVIITIIIVVQGVLFGESYLDSQNLESRPMAEKKEARSGRPTGSFCSATDLFKFIITKVTYSPLSTVSIKLYRL